MKWAILMVSLSVSLVLYYIVNGYEIICVNTPSAKYVAVCAINDKKDNTLHYTMLHDTEYKGRSIWKPSNRLMANHVVRTILRANKETVTWVLINLGMTVT